MARGGNVLRAHRVNQGSTAAALGCDGDDDTGSGGGGTTGMGLGALGHVVELR